MPRIGMLFISSFINSFAALYCCSKIIHEKVDFEKRSFWIAVLLESIYMTVGYVITDNYIRILINSILLSAINVVLFKIKTIQGVLCSFISMGVILISEILVVIFLIFFFHVSSIQLENNYFGDSLVTILICFLSFSIMQVRPFVTFFQKLIQDVKTLSSKTILLFVVILQLNMFLLLYYIYFEVNFLEATILCFILIITFTLLTLFLFKEKNDNQKLQIEYDILLNNLEEYESMYQLQKKINHDYKSELSEIRGMVHKNNQKLIKYLDELIDIKTPIKATWMDTLKLIPDSALRGLLYYKFSVMEQKNIQIEFDISKKVSIRRFKKISSNLNKKICKILGIYLDNAIQSVEKLKNKHIKVSIYLDVENSDILFFSIMNNYEGCIDLSRINEIGYSTKGKGRGLGLSIVNDILNDEKKLEHQTQIIRNNFVQELEIRL